MSRFSSDDYEEMFPNQGDFWYANVERAIQGKRGQRDLRTLETALLLLPQKRLIHGRLAKGAEVCAVGAFALQRRLEKGEAREDVLRDLEGCVVVYCAECYHTEEEHGFGPCKRCSELIAAGRRGSKHPCPAFVDDEESETEDYGDATAEVGKRAGMTYTLAWRIGSLNDEDFAHCTPEERYERVLAWVRERILPEEVAA